MVYISKEEYADILSHFLKDIDFEMPSWGYDHSLEQPVVEYFQTQKWEPHSKKKAVVMAQWMSTGLGMCYPFVNRESQIAIGIFAVYVLLIDDLAPHMSDALSEFQERLITNRKQKSDILQSLVNFLPTIGRFFGSYANAMITKSTIVFVYGCLLEQQYSDKSVAPPEAYSFPSYFRQKTGYAEPHAHFAFPQELYTEEACLKKYLPIIPDLCDFINYVNDVLSFYKESMVGSEKTNFICNYSNVHDISIQDALRRTCSFVVENARRIRKILAAYPEMLDTTNQFMRGYVAWYINQSRYRLSDFQITDKKGETILRTRDTSCA